jgi:hypothetical protein
MSFACIHLVHFKDEISPNSRRFVRHAKSTFFIAWLFLRGFGWYCFLTCHLPLLVCSIGVQMGRTTLHDTNTIKHDTNEHDTSQHDYSIVSCRSSTACRLLGPNTTRNTLISVVPARSARRVVYSTTQALFTQKNPQIKDIIKS